MPQPAAASSTTPGAAGDGPSVAYLINQYPGISHTFVRREIQALERQGVNVARFAIRPSRQGLISEEDKAEAAQTRYIVGAGAGALAAAIFKSFFHAPVRAGSAVGKALAMGWRSEAGLLRHLIYAAEAMALAAWLRAGNLAHVHAHFGTNSSTVALLAAHINNAAFSMTVHGPEEFDKPALISLAEKIKASAFAAGVSSFGASQLKRLAPPAFWDRIKIVHCGVEKSFYDNSADHEKEMQRGRFVCVGRLCEQKGQVTLVEAAGLLAQQGREFEIILVGDGEMRGDIMAAAKKYGVENKIVFAGWKTPAQVRAEIEAAQTFVLPSFAEGLPVSIMEAFCLSRPVISTYVAGIPELVLPGVNGWLAPAGDARRLAGVMAEALDANDEKLGEMGAAGKTRVTERHDIDAIARDLKKLFSDIADHKP